MSFASSFLVLPLSDLMRFDIPRQRFFFFGYELMISEFAILFFSLMFLMFLIAAMAMIYGRVYCGYLVPADDIQRGLGNARKPDSGAP